VRNTHYPDDENTQETLDEMSGREWVIGDELQYFLYHLRLQYGADLV
jgi:hypothetical protein